MVSGTKVTLDLTALTGNASFMSDSGIMFCVTTTRDWAQYGADTYITFSDITFA